MSCFTCIKVLMILFNLAIFLAGGTLLGVGIWVSVDSGSFLKVFGVLPHGVASQLVNVGYFLIAIGLLLLILGFLGCCGAQKESKCLLLTFFSIVLIIFIAEIAGAVVVLVYSPVIESILSSVLVPVLQKDFGRDEQVTRIWNATMTEVSSRDGGLPSPTRWLQAPPLSLQLNCCGVNGYGDFNNSAFVSSNNGHYPRPCCDSGAACTQQTADASHVKGCFRQILDLIKSKAAIVGGVAAGICALELAAMIVSMYLYCRLDKGGSIH
ncbi:hypothetical protein GDO78_019397 [Eleutherodactylus coqui]|uniref:Tetraspanin n=1 Tax=Eleutherodactylus coqui TaxID=57060 RepID=A0A8J6B638_ELECQ|nr:hypothetical protein GDO78_019397 [Eleutherodactylus coqui]